MRAITVRLDAESGVEGWARSGSYVDVIVIRASRIASSGFEASVIAENVKILSANRSTETSPSSSSTAQPATATLLVTQQDALAIKTAQNIGKLTFALRGISDTLPTYTQRFSEKTLAGSATQSPMVIRGTAVGPDGQSYVLDNNNRWLKRK
jgi:pilus assembly protein CpaB